jgi:hypothetical protein
MTENTIGIRGELRHGQLYSYIVPLLLPLEWMIFSRGTEMATLSGRVSETVFLTAVYPKTHTWQAPLFRSPLSCSEHSWSFTGGHLTLDRHEDSHIEYRNGAHGSHAVAVVPCSVLCELKNLSLTAVMV